MAELPALIQALLDPQTHPEKPAKTALLQTQMSFIVIAGGLVYKVKKPVNLGYLDYTTLEKRRHFCEQEVLLNRRLCPDAYLGVVPVTRQENRFRIDGEGAAVEYAVQMRYLPAEAMLDALLVRNGVSPEMIARVAEKVADFHRRAQTSAAISAFGSLEAVRGNCEENFSQTGKYTGAIIPEEQYRHIQARTGAFLRENASLFQQRARSGRIRDCHGDLHAAHVCFTDGICIYDCIEFNDRFRYGDVAAEVAFLAMDLDRYGRRDLSEHFVATYVAVSRDRELKALLNFYKGYRAYVRGKVACFKYDDPYIFAAERDRALTEARRYFALAASYL